MAGNRGGGACEDVEERGYVLILVTIYRLTGHKIRVQYRLFLLEIFNKGKYVLKMEKDAGRLWEAFHKLGKQIHDYEARRNNSLLMLLHMIHGLM